MTYFPPIQVQYFFCWLLLESWRKLSPKFFCLSYERLETLLVNHSDLGIWSPFATQHLFCLTFPQSPTAAFARLSTEFWSWSFRISYGVPASYYQKSEIRHRKCLSMWTRSMNGKMQKPIVTGKNILAQEFKKDRQAFLSMQWENWSWWWLLV